jgi:hypothetical protein
VPDTAAGLWLDGVLQVGAALVLHDDGVAHRVAVQV